MMIHWTRKSFTQNYRRTRTAMALLCLRTPLRYKSNKLAKKKKDFIRSISHLFFVFVFFVIVK